MLLSHLVGPETVKNHGASVEMLRRWQQNFYRLMELHASLPDSSLSPNGINTATSHLLAQNPSLGFRVNSFQNRASLDYNPMVATVVQLGRGRALMTKVLRPVELGTCVSARA